MRRLPSWLPLAVALFGFALVFILFEVPRQSEAADTALEAIPFVVMAVGVLLWPLSEPGRLRRAGGVLAVVLFTSFVWVPAGFGWIQDNFHEVPETTVRIEVTDPGGGAFTVRLPAPQPDPAWGVDWTERLRIVDGDPDATWQVRDGPNGTRLLLHATGSVTLAAAAEGDRDHEHPPEADVADEAPLLVEGATATTIHIDVDRDGRWCHFRQDYRARFVDGPDHTLVRDGVCS